MKYDQTVYTFETHQPRPFFAGSAGKGAARGREEDSLIVCLFPSDAQALTSELLEQTLNRLAAAFFKTGGSVTNAMRGLADGLNKALLSGNSQLQDKNSWQTAALAIGVVHRDTLFVGINGQAEVLVVKQDGQEHFFDRDLDPRGLGYSSIVHPRYFQTSVTDGDLLLLAGQIPMELLGSDKLKPNPIDLGEFEPQLEGAGIVRLTHGDGITRQAKLKPQTPDAPPTEEIETADEPEAVDLPQIEWPEEALETPEIEEESNSLAEDLFRNVPMIYPTPEVETQAEVDDLPVAEEDFVEEVDLPEPEPDMLDETRPTPVFDMRQFKADALHSVAKSAGWLKGIEEKTEALIQKGETAQSGDGEGFGELSPISKWLIAILVPIVLIGISTIIYLSQGPGNEYNYFLAQAKASASNAAMMQTDELKLEGWNQTVAWLDKAAAYQKSEEVNALYVQARLALDELEGAKRLIYKLAFAPGLYPEMIVSNIISLNRDLYVLDQTSGQIRHLTLQSRGYTPDDSFVCGPGTYGGVKVGALIDMLPIPINNPAKAPILGIDASGSLIYCSPGVKPSAAALTPPDGGWQELKSITFDSGRLFVLDSGTNAVWIYRGFDSNFDRVPVSYFDEMPVRLQSAVDLIVSKDELFVLHGDGHTSHCLASQISGLVTCDDPYPYQDIRGGEGGVDFSGLKFNQAAYSPPPDPSIYFLDPDKAELYQFSLLMNLNQVLRPRLSDGSLPTGKATAFAVAANRQVFLAFGNAVYYAVLP